MRIGVIFPGQGSQGVGMGVDLASKSEIARNLFERAQHVLGYDLLALQAQGPDEKLRETQYSQPAIFVTNIALALALGDGLDPIVSAGHSFGELCSLTLAGSLGFEDALRIVNERAQAMQEAAQLAPGGMSAVLGLDAELIRDVVKTVRERGLRLQLANFNAPTQIVISGDLAAVHQAGDALLEVGAKRVVPLNVSGAWHSELMRPAVARFAKAIEAASFSLPRFDVISNVDALAYRDIVTIRTNLVRSITDEVRWHETALAVLAHRLDLVIECGASPVLAPILKRLPDVPEVLQIGDYSAVAKLIERVDVAGVNA